MISSVVTLYVRASFQPDHFLTLFLGELDRVSGVLAYCNAGHPPAIVFAGDGRVLELEGRDPAFNIAPWGKYALRRHCMAPGDLLLVYTDGLIEEETDGGKVFGPERLIDCVRENSSEDLEKIGRDLLACAGPLSAAGRQHDDMSLILLRREDPSGERGAEH